MILQKILSEFQPTFRFCTKEFSHGLNFINICITEYTSLAMDFALDDTSSLRLELQDCGGLESYLMLRIYQYDGQCNYYTVMGNGPEDLGKIFENETDCGKVMICKESDTSAGKESY